MPIDTSIYSTFAQKPKSVADYQAEYDRQALDKQAMQQNALMLQSSRQKLDEYGRSVKEQETVRNALAGASNDEARVNALYGTGTQLGMSQADAIRKQMAERQKAKSEAAKTNASLLKQYSGILVQSPTMQTFESLAAHYTQQTGENIDNIRAIVQQSNGDPEVIRKIGAALSMEADKLLPKTQTVDAGNARVQQAVDPLSGVATETGRVPIMQSPDSVATERSAAAGRAVTMRGQDLTNARATEANSINKMLTTEKKQLEVDALKRGKDASISAASNQIAVIDKALNHPGRTTATGLSGTLDPRNYTPGTDATDFRSVLDQIGGSAFLQAFESLKGGGAITEVEGKRATDAIARLNRAQSDAEFETSLRDLRKVMTDGYKRLSGADYAVAGAASGGAPVQVTTDADYNALPPGTRFVTPDGKTGTKR